MSLWTKIRDTVIKPVVRTVAAGYTGGASEVLFRGLSGSTNPSPMTSVVNPPDGGWSDTKGVFPSQRARTLPGGAAMQPAMGRVLPLLPGVGRGLSLSPAAGGGARAAGYAAGKLTGQAMSWCKRNPAWCSSIGLAGIEAALQSGQIPPLKRRRARGITGTELRAFRRVVRFTSKYCAPVHKAMKAPVMRKHRR